MLVTYDLNTVNYTWMLTVKNPCPSIRLCSLNTITTFW